jgi:NAD(P)H-dependent FMN reductase
MVTPETTSLRIPVVVGSVRVGRRSHRAAALIAERISAAGYHAAILDLKELALPWNDDEESNLAHVGLTHLRHVLQTSDASVWLSPEYNHGYTAAIKAALDHLGDELRRKPVVVCGLSSGQMGGVRAVEQLKLVMIEVQAVPLRESVYFSMAGELFDDDGRAAHGRVVERIDAAIADLVWYAAALKAARG